MTSFVGLHAFVLWDQDGSSQQGTDKRDAGMSIAKFDLSEAALGS